MAKKVKVTVKKGDTLSAIAKANNTTVAKIAAANPQITNVNKISVNQKITLPPATTTKPKSSTPIVTMGANTSGQFAGPIPTGTTRTATGYEAVPTSVDAIRNALTKLTSGGVLTDAERILLGMTPVKSSPDKIDAPDEMTMMHLMMTMMHLMMTMMHLMMTMMHLMMTIKELSRRLKKSTMQNNVL
jgi:murein DD-endopeptidase MepM/ murein hydrolase activator NlpD